MSDVSKSKLGPRTSRPTKSVKDTFRSTEGAPTTKTSLALNADLYTQLKVYAAANNLQVSKLVNEAISDLLEKHR